MLMHESLIVAFEGKRGAGKTLTCSYFINMLVNAKPETKVFSNYALHCCEYEFVDSQFFKKFFKKETKGDDMNELNGSILVIDEIPTYLDSREWHSKKAKLFSNFIRQTRKRNIHVFYTTQQMHMVPKRIRDNTDILIQPHFNKELDHLTYEVFDYTNEYEFISSKTIANASQYFKLYDTTQIIDFLDFDDD